MRSGVGRKATARSDTDEAGCSGQLADDPARREVHDNRLGPVVVLGKGQDITDPEAVVLNGRRLRPMN
jgi:hypothetical protein